MSRARARPKPQYQPHPTLSAMVKGTAIVLSHSEDTSLLVAALRSEGLKVVELRQVHEAHHAGLSPSFLCLMNHMVAWRLALKRRCPTLIVEADFVPVRGFGLLPAPFNPTSPRVGVAWLYSTGARMYSVTKEGFIEGGSTSTVAMAVTPAAAYELLHYSEHVRKATNGGLEYCPWDSGIDGYLISRGFKNYLAFKNYGEHGGRSNPEHSQRIRAAWPHRADVLWSELLFRPGYAPEGHRGNLRGAAIRLHARVRGLARFALGYYLRPKILMGSSFPMRLLLTAVARQLPWTEPPRYET